MLRHLLLFVLCFAAAFAFEPPSASDRIDALGSLEGEEPILQRLLEPEDDFPPIHAPEFGDWLATHYESGQTYAAYAKSAFNRPSTERKIIYLLPIGDFPEENSPPLEDLKAYAEAFFQLDVQILPAVSLEEGKFHSRIGEFTQKRQLLTSGILTFLKTQLPPNAYCLLGVTMEDLYPAPSWNYVFGQASLAERVGIYSFARYDPQFFGQKRTSEYRQLILRRSCKVLAHETGHMFGMAHCIHFECLMNGSNTLGETDINPQYLCPVCLRKLHFNVRFDPVARYEDLARFYRNHKWEEELRWTEQQLGKVKNH